MKGNKSICFILFNHLLKDGYVYGVGILMSMDKVTEAYGNLTVLLLILSMNAVIY